MILFVVTDDPKIKGALNMCKNEKGYNGYSNYETWVVNLWINNDEKVYNEMKNTVEPVNKECDGSNVYTIDEVNKLAISAQNEGTTAVDLITSDDDDYDVDIPEIPESAKAFRDDENESRSIYQ